MTETVVIATAGLGSRLGSIGEHINKALLPYLHKPIIGHIIDAFPRDSRFIVLTGYRSDQVRWFLGSTYPDRDINFIDVPIWCGENSGTGISLLQAKDYINGPFWYSSCDTFWSEPLPIGCLQADTYFATREMQAPAESYTTFNMDGDRIASIRYKEPSDTGLAFTGLMYIHDHAAFLRRLEDERYLEFISALDVKGQVRSLDSWKDMGTWELYRKHVLDQSPYDFSKQDELIWIFNGRIVKWNRDQRISSARIARALANPEACPNGLINHGSFMAYDMVQGETIYSCDTFDLERFLGWIDRVVWKAVAVDNPYRSCLSFYRDKTIDRVDLFASLGRRSLHATSVNGVPVKPWRSYLDSINWEELSTTSRMVWIHGDLQFDNVIAKEDGGFTAIDWRPSFADQPIAGDAHYDVAKMIGGCIIDYRMIKMNRFSVRSHGDQWDLSIPSFDQQDMIDRILSWAAEQGLDVKKIRTLVPLIFWNMSPLHTPPFDDLLWCLGLRLFEELANG